MEWLQGEELQEHLQRVNELLNATNTHQDRLDRPAGSVSHRSKDPEREQQNTTSNPRPNEAQSGQTRTRRTRVMTAGDSLGNEPATGG